MKNSTSLFAAQEQVQVKKTRKNAPAKVKAEENKAAQKTETKAKAPAKAKAAPKVASKQASAPTAKGIAYTIIGRPSSGKALIAHTQAVFMLTGILEGKAVDKKVLRAALGDTALAYHKNKFENLGAQLKLTEGGKFFFTERFNKAFGAADSELAKASVKPFILALSEGKSSDADYCKNAAMFCKIA